MVSLGPPTGSAEWSIAKTVRATRGSELNYLKQASGLPSQKGHKGRLCGGQRGKCHVGTLGEYEARGGKAIGHLHGTAVRDGGKPGAPKKAQGP